jgi:hypothetical protein
MTKENRKRTKKKVNVIVKHILEKKPFPTYTLACRTTMPQQSILSPIS